MIREGNLHRLVLDLTNLLHLHGNAIPATLAAASLFLLDGLLSCLNADLLVTHGAVRLAGHGEDLFHHERRVVLLSVSLLLNAMDVCCVHLVGTLLVGGVILDETDGVPGLHQGAEVGRSVHHSAVLSVIWAAIIS